MPILLPKYRQINKVVLLPVDKIVPNPMQPRKVFEEQALRGLADSIAENGLINPITVRTKGDGRFELIAGERRLQATRLLGKSHIGAIIEDADSESSAVVAMVENLQRQQLHIFEEAEGIETLIRVQNMTQQKVADRLGVAQSTIANKLRLLKLPQEARELITLNNLSERHARALLTLSGDDGRIMSALNHIIDKNLNVKETEDYISSLDMPPRKKGRRVAVIKDLRIFFNTVDKAVKTMRQAGLGIDATREEDELSYTYTIVIPKSAHSAKRKSSA